MERRVGRFDAFRNGTNWDEEDGSSTQRVVPPKSPFVRQVPYQFHFGDDDEDGGHHRINGSPGRRGHIWEPKDYHPKRILTFNGRVSDKEFLEWNSYVDHFFDYFDIPDNRSQVDRVVYRLRGKVLTWWKKLQVDRIQDGKEPIFAWRRLKQLLKARFMS
ncbi:hypothetical protein CDL15_Pgr023912 [Punica granatum]|uniref:Retrotransposon gag domain-containing protein n=1 Tax=Punica granatum TaxID=22663 RepID=A0A218XWN6_PUNGR|nr:hypothetical protein CDL15_Pgr023912 [Punica granatum]